MLAKEGYNRASSKIGLGDASYHVLHARPSSAKTYPGALRQPGIGISSVDTGLLMAHMDHLDILPRYTQQQTPHVCSLNTKKVFHSLLFKNLTNYLATIRFSHLVSFAN
jgi:hypothetical protein